MSQFTLVEKPATLVFIEPKNEQELLNAPMHKIMEYFFWYMKEKPEQMDQYANSILSVFSETPQPYILHICEPMSNTIKTFPPFWKVFFYYFLTYFGFPTRKSRLIQDFLWCLFLCRMTSCYYYVYDLLDSFLEKYQETQSDQVIQKRLANIINNGHLPYGNKSSVIQAILKNTDHLCTRVVKREFDDHLQTDQWYAELFFLVIQAMNNWKPKTFNLDVEFLKKWKRRIQIRDISYMTMDEFYHADEITEDDLGSYSEYEKYEELCNDSESDGRDY